MPRRLYIHPTQVRVLTRRRRLSTTQAVDIVHGCGSRIYYSTCGISRWHSGVKVNALPEHVRNNEFQRDVGLGLNFSPRGLRRD
jgi:hypothetical protein